MDENVSPSDENEFLNAVFGEPASDAPQQQALALKTSFAPWHHPIKQIVRERQWAALTKRLLTEERSPDDRRSLRYFTLPGADLLDVRVLVDALSEYETIVDYFGFNSATPKNDVSGAAGSSEVGASFAVESALRQSGLVAARAQVLPDRLEDIAQKGSQAASRLKQLQPFDVINIDGCDHLGFIPENRSRSTFDAIETLLAHQLMYRKPWLLFITTRADPGLLGPHFNKMQKAVADNIEIDDGKFGLALAECIGAELKTLTSAMNQAWSQQSVNFLKMYSIGLGKYFLHFFHNQHNLSAEVELVSTYAYRVHGDNPDMLSLAFRIRPREVLVQSASPIGVSVVDKLEPKLGKKVAERAAKLWVIDGALDNDEALRKLVVDGTAKLLADASYDLASWREWLARHQQRPMIVAEG